MTTPPPPFASFGAYLAHTRTGAGYTAKALAAEVGIATSTITRLERGDMTVPGPDLLCKLGDFLRFDYATAVGLLEPYRRLWQRLQGETTHG
jgi:transcriptional regulator with XRE-family HTH domain